MKCSESIAKISEALAKAQGNMGPLIKGKQNPYYKSNYADLAAVVNVCRPALSEEGVSFVQGSALADSKLTVTTLLSHRSGEWIESSVQIGAGNKNDPQSAGSALTYGRRYGLMAAVGLAPDDDDGNDASQGQNKQNGKQQKPKKPAPAKKPEPNAFAQKHQNALWAEIEAADLIYKSEAQKDNFRKAVLTDPKGAEHHAILIKFFIFFEGEGVNENMEALLKAASNGEMSLLAEIDQNVKDEGSHEVLADTYKALKQSFRGWLKQPEGDAALAEAHGVKAEVMYK